MADDGDDEPLYRLSDLDPRLQRTAARIRSLPAGHRRNRPDPDNPSRPELEILEHARAMRLAIERREKDETLERCWLAGEETVGALGITHEWLPRVVDFHHRPGTRTVSDGADNMAASMVHITATDEALELAFMERDWPPLVCRFRPNHARGLARLVREALAPESSERHRYDTTGGRWAGVRAAPAQSHGSIILEAQFESIGQRVRLPRPEVTRLLELLDGY